MLPRLLLPLALAVLPCTFPSNCRAAGPYENLAQECVHEIRALPTAQPRLHKEPQRLVAAGLAITLGAFGAHRLYLGTDVKVPIIYGLTFGGFGVLVLIDLGHILFSKDLQAFYNNDQVFMWAKGLGASSPTPP